MGPSYPLQKTKIVTSFLSLSYFKVSNVKVYRRSSETSFYRFMSSKRYRRAKQVKVKLHTTVPLIKLIFQKLVQYYLSSTRLCSTRSLCSTRFLMAKFFIPLSSEVSKNGLDNWQLNCLYLLKSYQINLDVIRI